MKQIIGKEINFIKRMLKPNSTLNLNVTMIDSMKKEFQTRFVFFNVKLGCVVRMVVDSILPHAESGPNDHRKDASPFISSFSTNKNVF